MRLRLSVPTNVVMDEQVEKVIAESMTGSFCLLPRHVDVFTALVAGVLSLTKPDGTEMFFAVDEGLLLKQGEQVLVSTRQAIRGDNLGELQIAVRDVFASLDEREKACQSAIASLEANFVRGFMKFQQGATG